MQGWREQSSIKRSEQPEANRGPEVDKPIHVEVQCSCMRRVETDFNYIILYSEGLTEPRDKRVSKANKASQGDSRTQWLDKTGKDQRGTLELAAARETLELAAECPAEGARHVVRGTRKEE